MHYIVIFTKDGTTAVEGPIEAPNPEFAVNKAERINNYNINPNWETTEVYEIAQTSSGDPVLYTPGDLDR